MFAGSLDYTICSTDPEHYNRITCNLLAPMTKYASFIVTSLTANLDLVVLNQDDYIVYQEWDEFTYECSLIKIQISNEYKAMSRESALSALRLEICPEFEDSTDGTYKIENITTDTAGRYLLKRDNRWEIIDMSYNIKLMTGFYSMEFPVNSKFDEKERKYTIVANSVGFTMSTPILYLLSNVGIQSYKTVSENNISGAKIVMRLNNSYVADTPISVPNGDFRSTILSNDLSMITFTLVDANIKEIKLLSPIYLTVHVDAVEDEKMVAELLLYNRLNDDFKKIGKQKYSEEDYQNEYQNSYQDGNKIGDFIHRGAEYQDDYE